MARGRGRGGRGRGNGTGRRTSVERTSSNSQHEESDTFNSSLPERFRGNNVRRNAESSESMPNNGYRVELNTGIRNYVKAQEQIVQSNADKWQSLPEIASSDEIALNDNQAVTISANKIQGKWKTTEKYLKAHYELLREDSVSPLRDAVDAFRKDPGMLDNKDLAVYEKVHIRGFTFAYGGVAARITFSTARAGRKINWQSSNRLVSGSILALSPAKTKFASGCVVATVAARPKAGLECVPPEIDIYFSRPEDVEVDPQVEWLMIEAKKGYYESHRHTMRALQKLHGESFPLQNHICYLDSNLAPPAYIHTDDNYDLSAAIPDIAKRDPLQKVNIINDWPDAPRESLDETQWEAMRQILTKDLSIIQGPPGTGKTFVSKIALQILVENRSQGDPPIIVAAQTNHALDQLLKHVANFDPEYIRLGGRSTDEDVKKRALFEIRQANRLPPIASGLLGVASKRQEQETHNLRELLEPLSPRNSRNPFSAAALFELKVLTRDQADSLVAGAREWVTGGMEATNETKVWLGKALMPWNVTYKEDNFGFEEAEDDLEFEQLREHEAESGQNDQEDVELLKGYWCGVEQLHTVAIPPPALVARAKQQLDLNADLWKIPQVLRGPVYFIILEKAKTAVAVKFRDQVKSYNDICQNLKIGKFERDAVYLSKANIIGLTTTGLSKYRPLIASMKPKIILIEEAAEVIEAPVTAACVESLEHLILVGDHKQLQGHCAVEELGQPPYNLNVSMFERLVNNNIPFKTLLSQRRMDPAFRALLQPIYPELQDHPSVIIRDPLPAYGMGDVKSFFLDHDWPELRDANMSVFNDKEALFVAGFYEYLMMNGVHPSKITILTFYNGQRKRILKYIRDRPLCKAEYHNVKTVDSYQGEENEIIILSLVRNASNIGFLEKENRVCVALSRAKRGFYLLGNSNCLSINSRLWSEVLAMLGREVHPRIGNVLPTQCNKHGRTSLMEHPEDWSSERAGCDLRCDENLTCGHACNLTCHPFDHSYLKCTSPCDKQLPCGHPCQKGCSETCLCDCPNSANYGEQGPDEPDNGSRRGFQNNRGSGIANNENGWTYDGNDSWAAGAQAENSNSSAWNGDTPDTGWTHSMSVSNKHWHPKKSDGLRRLHKEPCHVLKWLPTGPEDDKSFPLLHKKITHSSRPSTASSTTQPSYRSPTPGPFGGSQHSPERQEVRREGWSVFAGGGVKTDDQERAKARVLQRKADATARLENFDNSTAFPLENSLPVVKDITITTRKDGRVVFSESYQSAGFEATTWIPEVLDSAPKLPHKVSESCTLLEPSLLD